MNKKLRNFLLRAVYVVGIVACWCQTLYTGVLVHPEHETDFIVWSYGRNPITWYRDYFGFIILSMILVAAYVLLVLKFIKIPEQKNSGKSSKLNRVIRAEIIYLIVPVLLTAGLILTNDLP